MRPTFRLKLALVTAAFAALPLAVVSYALIGANAREVESSQQALQIASVSLVASTLDAEIAAAHAGLEAIATTLTDEGLEESSRVTLVLRQVESTPTLETVAIHDADGALVDRVTRPGSSRSTPDVLAPEARGEMTLSGAGERQLLLSLPIVVDGRTTGYLAAPLPLQETHARAAAISRELLPSEGGRASVLHASGRVLAGPAVRAPPTSEELAQSSSTLVSAERTDASGRRYISTLAHLEHAPLVVVAEVPRDVVYAPIETLWWSVAGTALVTLLAAFVLAFLFARRLSAPVGALVDFTRELAARRFDSRVEVTSGDELETLGDALNAAADELARSEARVREEEAIRNDLGRYLPAELVEQVIRREQNMELGGQRTQITVLFADVVAFTPLSESLPPEQVVALLNELFSLLTEAVFRNGGTVDKFVGDCVMALFGAPAPHVDHAARALACARDMMRFVEVANAGWRETIGVEVQLAIGINGGEAVVGNVGSKERMEYTAIGDVVNVAARLETIARPGQILASRATLDAADERADSTRVGEREVPGRSAPVELYEVEW